MVEGHCLQAMKVVHHYANGSFDWLISGQQSVNLWREGISILSEKYKRFKFVHSLQARAKLSAFEYENKESRESSNYTERSNWSSIKEALYRNPDMSQNLKGK